MIAKKFYKFIFWVWDKLSEVGAKPYTKIARWLVITTGIILLMPPLMWVIYSLILPLWCSTKYEIRKRKWPWYILSVIPVAIWIGTYQFLAVFELFCDAIWVFALMSIIGFYFNKKIGPVLAQALAEYEFEMELKEGIIPDEAETEEENRETENDAKTQNKYKEKS